MEDKTYQEKLEKLNEDLVLITLELQKEVSELKEDTFLNALHIKKLKEGSGKNFENIENCMETHIKDTSEMIEDVFTESENQENKDYAKFLKELLDSDFRATQAEMIENAKREILNMKNSATKSKNSKFDSRIIFNAMSVISFVLILFISIKYKIFFG